LTVSFSQEGVEPDNVTCWYLHDVLLKDADGMPIADVTVSKNGHFAPFTYRYDHLAKTGSGQT
jgi:hypothetical protein